MVFKISVPVPSSQQIFENLSHFIGMLGWFDSHNRPYKRQALEKLEDPLINSMIREAKDLSDDNYPVFYDKFFAEFTEKLYCRSNLEKIARQFEEYIPIIMQASPKFEALNKSWGFKIWDEYVIDLSLYTSGGQYNYGNGHVILGCGRGTNLPPLTAAFTVLHEMVHLGIETLIINPEGREEPRVAQEEKERIVDNLCLFMCSDIAEFCDLEPKYQEVAAGATYMDAVVGKQPETNLPRAVEDFLRGQRRL